MAIVDQTIIRRSGRFTKTVSCEVKPMRARHTKEIWAIALLAEFVPTAPTRIEMQSRIGPRKLTGARPGKAFRVGSGLKNPLAAGN